MIKQCDVSSPRGVRVYARGGIFNSVVMSRLVAEISFFIDFSSRRKQCKHDIKMGKVQAVDVEKLSFTMAASVSNNIRDCNSGPFQCLAGAHSKFGDT
jgi:hypothetical protein